MTFVDTNYFLRFLLGDHQAHHATARTLFDDAAAGKIKLFTSVLVFFEIYWVLSSFYRKKKTELLSQMTDILNLEFIDLEERPLLEEALALFRTLSIELEDAYNLVYAYHRDARDFATFDKKLLNQWRKSEGNLKENIRKGFNKYKKGQSKPIDHLLNNLE